MPLFRCIDDNTRLPIDRLPGHIAIINILVRWANLQYRQVHFMLTNLMWVGKATKGTVRSSSWNTPEVRPRNTDQGVEARRRRESSFEPHDCQWNMFSDWCLENWHGIGLWRQCSTCRMTLPRVRQGTFSVWHGAHSELSGIGRAGYEKPRTRYWSSC